MKSFFERYWLVSSLSFICILGIYVRFNIETSAMQSQEVEKLKQTQFTYSTQLRINNDVEHVNFTAKVVASDLKINKRVIAVGSTETNGLLSGLKVGDVISVTGYLGALSEYEQYKKREHIVGVFRIESISDLMLSNSKLNSSTQALRDQITRGCANLEIDERGVCEGLLIGKRNHIDRELYGTYKKAQLTHLLVASGANIAFLVGFLMPVISKLRRSTRSFALISVAVLYCAATRFEPSILRACVMVVIPAVLSSKGYGISKASIFVSTVLVCGLLDPFLLFRVGFWLSLSATGGLFFVAPKLVKVVKSEILSNTLSATLCVQPVLWVVFGFGAPVRWWVSVIAVAIAEPLSTAGLFLVILVSFIGTQSFIGQIAIFPVHLGCIALNVTAKIGASNIGYWVGWAFTVIGIIAYTYNRQVNREGNLEDVDQFSVLHYRRRP